MVVEDELVRLQCWVSHQDDSLNKMNEVITRQQQEITTLVQQVDLMRKQLQMLMSSSVGEADEPPPHY